MNIKRSQKVEMAVHQHLLYSISKNLTFFAKMASLRTLVVCAFLGCILVSAVQFLIVESIKTLNGILGKHCICSTK